MPTPGRPLLVLLLIASVLVGALAACSDEGEPRLAPPGAVVNSFGEPNGRLLTVVLPTGRLDMTLGDPATSMSRSTEYEEAPEGTQAVLVGWRFESTADIVSSHVALTGQPALSIDLLSGGEAYSLDDLMLTEAGDGSEQTAGPAITPSGSGYAVLPGSKGEIYGDLAVAVDFDGLTQTVEVDGTMPDVGAAEPLYQDPLSLAPRRLECGEPRAEVGAEVSQEHCTAAVQLTPWWPGLGWPEEGRRWRVVSPDVGAFVVGADGRQASIGTSDVTVRVGGRQPVLVDDPGFTFVFAAAEDLAARPLALTVSNAEREYDGSLVELTWSVELAE